MREVGRCRDELGDEITVFTGRDVAVRFDSDSGRDGAQVIMYFGPEALAQFRELLDRAAMPGQAEAGGAVSGRG